MATTGGAHTAHQAELGRIRLARPSLFLVSLRAARGGGGVTKLTHAKSRVPERSYFGDLCKYMFLLRAVISTRVRMLRMMA